MLLVSLVMIAPSVSGQKLKADEIIAKHLSSIGSAEKRALLKTLMAVGDVKVDYITPKDPPTFGRVVIASEGVKSIFWMRFDAMNYPHEKLIFDGTRADVALVWGGNRSVLGNFLQANSSIISQGLISGTLATSWNLLAAAERGAKITSSGSKKIDGKEAYALAIIPKGGSDLDIKMYFDQQTFQHLRTEYSRVSSASPGRTIDASARQYETRFKITEDFSDHQNYEGLTIPRKYRLHYSVSGQNGTNEFVWTCNFSEFAINQALGPETFVIGK